MTPVGGYCPGLPHDPIPCRAAVAVAGALCRDCWERELAELAIPLCDRAGRIPTELEAE
jgi:hypothetical protein